VTFSRGLLAFALLAAILLSVAPAGAVRSAGAKSYKFRVVAVTHSSSSKKNEPPFYVGSSTATWHLARATSKAPNRITVNIGPGFSGGLGYINATGTFTAQATTNRTNGQCQLTAPTGSKQYPAVAPGRFPLTVSPAFVGKGRFGVAIGPGGDVYATLGNPYFPSECSTSLSGEPDADVSSLISVPQAIFTHLNVTLRFAGSSSAQGIDYRWSTTIKLKRIVKKR
jgi:hypothetical protein